MHATEGAVEYAVAQAAREPRRFSRAYPSANGPPPGFESRRRRSATRSGSLAELVQRDEDQTGPPALRGVHCATLSEDGEQRSVADRAGRSTCICGASAYFERLKQRLRQEQHKLAQSKQEVLTLRNHINEEWKRLQRGQAEVTAELRTVEALRSEVDGVVTDVKAERRRLDDDCEALKQRQRKVYEEQEMLANERLQWKHTARELESQRVALQRSKAKVQQLHQKLTDEQEELCRKQETVIQERAILTEKHALVQEQCKQVEERCEGLKQMEARVNEQLVALDERSELLDRRAGQLTSEMAQLEKNREEFVKRCARYDAVLAKKQEKVERDSLAVAEQERHLKDRERTVAEKADELQSNSEDFEQYVALQKGWLSEERQACEQERLKFAAERKLVDELAAETRRVISREFQQGYETLKVAHSESESALQACAAELDRRAQQVQRTEQQVATSNTAVVQQQRLLESAQESFCRLKQEQNVQLEEQRRKLEAEAEALRTQHVQADAREDQLRLLADDLQELKDSMRRREADVQALGEHYKDLLAKIEDEKAVVDEKADDLHQRALSLRNQLEALQRREAEVTQASERCRLVADLVEDVAAQRQLVELQRRQLSIERQALVAPAAPGLFPTPSRQRSRPVPQDKVPQQLPPLQTNELVASVWRRSLRSVSSSSTSDGAIGEAKHELRPAIASSSKLLETIATYEAATSVQNQENIMPGQSTWTTGGGSQVPHAPKIVS